MSGTNTYEEHLHYNEKGRNKKSIVFDSRQLVDPCQNFWIHATRAKILTYAIFLTLAKIYETMPFTPPTSKSDQPHSHQQRYLADSMILNGKT